MKKLTQILNLFNTANCIDPDNTDGKMLGLPEYGLVKIKPLKSLEKLIQSLGGITVFTNSSTQIILPIIFENNTVNVSLLDRLPEVLLFEIVATSAENIRYTGLNFNKKILFLEPKNNSIEYTHFLKKTNLKPCGKANIIGQADAFNFIHNDINFDKLATLIEQSISLGDQLIDLKITVGVDEIIIHKHDDLKIFHEKLNLNLFKKIDISFRRNSDNSLLKNFTEVLIVPGSMDPKSIGILAFPKNLIIKNETDQKKYVDLNNYICHLPSVLAKINLVLNTNLFENGSKLFLDNTEINNPSVINHPQIANYKQVTATVNDYLMLINKQKLISIQKAQKKQVFPIEPIYSFDLNTKTANINITK